MADPQRVVRGLRRRLGRVRRALLRSAPSDRAPSAGGRTSATPRDGSVEPTNIGPIFDEAVARVRSQMTPAGVDGDYDLVYEHFDLPHFLLQARYLLTRDGIDPLEAFLANGPEAKASPEINFDTAAYLARHPERAIGPERSPYLSWLKQGKAAGEIADPAPGVEKMATVLGLEPGDLVDLLGTTRLDIQERLRSGTLGRMLASAAEVEPLIGDVWSATTDLRIPPLRSADTVDQVFAISSCQEAAGFARARLLIVTASPRWGGGRRAEGHIAHALAGRIDPAEIVVIYTDSGGAAPPGRFPDGVREIDLATSVSGLPPDAAGRVLVELIRSFRAEVVVNVNSVLLYRAMTTYGRALAASERIFLVVFGNEQLALGNWVGLPLRYFYRSFDLVEGVIADSHHLAEWLVERHQLSDEMGRRIHVFSAPVDPAVPVASAPPRDPGRRPQVFWAGRFDRQKRVDLAFEIARRMPDVDFQVWGEEVLNRPTTGPPPPNARVHGAYRRLSDVDLTQADVWLYTSAWDGVPGQLLEVAMTGVPLVGTLVGGTGEVLDERCSWPVDDLDDPDRYVAAIREVLADPVQARRKALDLRELLIETRTEECYADLATRVLLRPQGAEGSDE